MDLFVNDALRGRLTEAVSARRFVEAGNATLTLVSRSGVRFTYKFQRPRQDLEGAPYGASGDPADQSGEHDAAKALARPIFVKLLSGPDNEGDYTYMGMLRPHAMSELVRTRASRVGSMALSWKGITWFLFHLYHEKGDRVRLFEQLEVWHEGRCGRCGRKLTVPDSVRTGFGPDCAEMVLP